MTKMTANAPEGTPCWLDLGIPDIARATEFYGALFGWEFQDAGPETGHYHTCLLRGEQVAAIMPNHDAAPDGYWWQLYFATDDCDGTVKRVTDAGGSVVSGAMDVMDQGRMAIVKDPAGGQFGLWQGRAHIGAHIVNEPGSLVWNELVAPEPEPVREFYRSVFGYTLEPIPGDLDYTVLNRPDGGPVGGIMGLREAPGAFWRSYFEVEDTDAAVRRAQDAGGTLVDGPEDSPYGRLATVRDPFGAELALMKSAPAPTG